MSCDNLYLNIPGRIYNREHSLYVIDLSLTQWVLVEVVARKFNWSNKLRVRAFLYNIYIYIYTYVYNFWYII